MEEIEKSKVEERGIVRSCCGKRGHPPTGGLTWRDVLYQWAHLLESMEEYTSQCLDTLIYTTNLEWILGQVSDGAMDGCGTQKLQCNSLGHVCLAFFSTCPADTCHRAIFLTTGVVHGVTRSHTSILHASFYYFCLGCILFVVSMS
jgi:hypothetical protein